MLNLNLSLVTDNFTTANVIGKGNGVKLEVDPELTWDRAGLVQLSAALAGLHGCCLISRAQRQEESSCSYRGRLLFCRSGTA